MSPTIRIDDDVFEELKKSAEPFVDTPNTVLRRLLGLAVVPDAEGVVEPDRAQALSDRRSSGRKASGRRRKRLPRATRGSTLPDVEYELPILEILRDKGGRAATREVIDALGERLDGRLTSTDHQRLSSGDVRWRNRAQFVRLKMIRQGDMIGGSPRGVWEISKQGAHRLEQSGFR